MSTDGICKQLQDKGSPYSTTVRRVPELIPALGSQPPGDMSHKPGGRLPLLSARPAVCDRHAHRNTDSLPVRSDISRTTYIDVINFSAFSVAMARSSYIRLVPATYGSINKSGLRLAYDLGLVLGCCVMDRIRVSIMVRLVYGIGLGFPVLIDSPVLCKVLNACVYGNLTQAVCMRRVRCATFRLVFLLLWAASYTCLLYTSPSPRD